MKYRIIHMTKGDIAEEEVVFTEDFQSKAEDWLSAGFKVLTDTTIITALPNTFPLEVTLKKTM